MVRKSIPEEYIPDSSDAEVWITEDTFIVLGVIYRILPDGNVVPTNGNVKEGG